MNKLKKTVFGLVIAGLAFGFSAFKTYNSRNILTYYRLDPVYLDPADPSGYYYFSGDRCEPGGTVCSAKWDIGINLPPAETEALPFTGVIFQPGTVVLNAHFE